jgi:hypothetical protein
MKEGGISLENNTLDLMKLFILYLIIIESMKGKEMFNKIIKLDYNHLMC